MNGWRFWPEPEPIGPDGYVQQQWVRPYRPGLVRVLTAVGLTMAAATVAGVGLLAGWAQPSWIGRLIGVTGALLAALTLGWLAGRTFAAGVWVTDAGVRVLGLVEDRILPWTAVVDVSETDGSRVLGLPVRGPGRTVSLQLADGQTVRTPLNSTSPDFIGRPEPYLQAAGAIQRWWWECR
jgi:hypothetical protein